MPDQSQSEAFQVIAEITNRYWQRTQMNGSAALAVGPFASLPAVTVPQAQLDLSHAIREAFHAGAALQASLQPMRWVMALDPAGPFDDPSRVVTMVATPHPPIDLSKVELPQREPNAYERIFAEEALQLQLVCPTCHQSLSVPKAQEPVGAMP